MRPNTGEESGFQDVPDDSRDIRSPILTVEVSIGMECKPGPCISIPVIEDISGVGVGAAFGLMSMPGIEDMSGVGVGVECWPTAAPTSRIRHESNRHILL